LNLTGFGCYPIISFQPTTFGEQSTMKRWICIICGFVYDEELGLPQEGIAPGTRWEDIPDDWLCPDCGVGKSDFEMVAL